MSQITKAVKYSKALAPVPPPKKEEVVDDDAKSVIIDPVSLAKSEILAARKRVFQMMGRPRGMKSGQTDEVKVNLIINYNNTGSVGAANVSTASLVPGSSSEWSNWAAEFDEVIVDAATIHHRAYLSATNQTSGLDYATSYDPFDSTALTSVNNALECRYHAGPFSFPTTGIAATPTPTSPTGFFLFKIKMPKGPQIKDPNAASVVGTGNWTSTNVSTTSYGYVKYYVEAPSTGTSTVVGHVILHCRFRRRS